MNRFIYKATRLLSDKMYIRLMYFKHFGRFPDLKTPKTYTEKMQWNKLYNRNPLYTVLADKIAVKEYIANTIGASYVIPTLKVWSNADEINLIDLPEKFILKCNHDSHSKHICTDKKCFDLESVKRDLNLHLQNNAFWYGREWSYKNIVPCVFAEELLEPPNGDLIDYKVMCFDGKAKLIMMNSNRFGKGGLKEAIYDLEWNKTDITQGYPSNQDYEKPDNFQEMIELSELLSKTINLVRVDWYSFSGKLYFGEFTFYDGSGFVPFDNPAHDLLLGSWFTINNE